MLFVCYHNKIIRVYDIMATKLLDNEKTVPNIIGNPKLENKVLFIYSLSLEW